MVRVYRGDRIWDWIRHVSGEPPIVLPSEQVSGGPVGGASARGKRRRERARSLLRRRAVRRAARPALQNRNGGGGGPGRVEDYLTKLTATPDFVLADPPRAGLGKSVAGHLMRLAPARLTIVSCDPATLARAIAALAGYEIERLILIDLFPQTYHLGTVARLHKH